MILEKVKKLASDIHPEVVICRRHLHSNPELSFKEFETSRYVQNKLREQGISFLSGVAGTGIVALIKGKNSEKKVVALRADMDALPINEQNEVAYKSKNIGVMHACGHDVHTASLLGACQILHELRKEFEGSVKCIFQPGEEELPGGASLMIKDGVLENPSPTTIVGQHVYPLLPVGTVGFRPGLFMASTDEIIMRVYGKGGHGAVPHLAKDPIAITAQMITALQQLVSRFCDPTIPTVLSFGSIQSKGGTYNVIPEMVEVKGTFRTFSEYWRFKAHDHIRKMAKGIAESMGARCDINIKVGYPFLVNNDELTNLCRDAAIEYLGPDHVREVPMRLTGEDFAYYTHHVHGCFYRLGVANPDKGITSPVHSPTFDIDEEALKTGAGLMAWIALRQLSN